MAVDQQPAHQGADTAEIDIEGEPIDASAERDASIAAPRNPASEYVRAPMSFPWLGLAVFALLAIFPHLPFIEFSVVGVAILAGQYAIVTASLVMLTGWVGQISLGHAALVGISAYTTGWAVGGWGLWFPLNILVPALVAAGFAGLLGTVALRVRGLYLAVATLIFSWMADAFLFRIETLIRHSFIDVKPLGAEGAIPRVDLTNRTTMYYVTWGVALAVLFLIANARDSRTGRAFFALKGSEIGAASLGIDVTRYKLLAFTFSGFLAGIAGALVMLDSRSLSPDTFKFTTSLFYLSMAVVGGLFSLGGAVASAILFASLNELFFRVRAFGDALDLVSAALLAGVLLLYRGGLAAVPGSLARLMTRVRSAAETHEPQAVKKFRTKLPKAVAGDLSGIRERLAASGRRLVSIPRNTLEVIAGALPGSIRTRIPGLGDRPEVQGQAYQIRRPTLLDAEGNLVQINEHGELRPVNEAIVVEDGEDGGPEAAGEDAETEPHMAAVNVRVALPEDRSGRVTLLEAEGITVQFGGLTAVSNASLSVREHEIVGLIGPNGAGKTTLFNAIAGLNSPTKGRVRLFAIDVTELPVHQRAHLGVARTFQAIQLFPELDVFDNLLVATHVHNETGFFRHLFAADSSLVSERDMRERVAQVIEELGLTDVAYRPVADLPFGVLRMVEVARAMVTDFPLIMLDEPASGLDNSETDRLSEMLLEIRAHGVTLLLIEHDVRMVTGISDYMYVINRGEIIAEGPPADVQRDPVVLSAYLGEPAGAKATDGEKQPAGVA